MKRTAYRHLKIKRLAIAIGHPIWAARGLAESLWHTTAAHAKCGNIGILTNAEIAEEIGWNGDPDALIDSLVAVGLVDRCPVHRLVVHDWQDHADRAIGLSIKRDGLQFVRAVCAQKAHTTRTESALPEPLPEPLPLPEPVSSPAASRRTHTSDAVSVVGVTEAVEAVNRWALASRGQELEPVRNELQRLEDKCADVWAVATPIVHGGQPVSPLVLVPEAVRRIMARSSPVRFNSVAYAVSVIDGELDEMRRFGTRDPTGPPDQSASRSAENAAIVARVLARRAGAAT